MSRDGPDQESESLEKLSHLFFIILQRDRFFSLVLCVILQMVMQRWDEEQVIGKGEKLLLWWLCWLGVISDCPWQVGCVEGNALHCHLETPLVPSLGFHWTKRVAHSYCSTQRAKRITRLCLRFPSGGLEGLISRNCLSFGDKEELKPEKQCLYWLGDFLEWKYKRKKHQKVHKRKTVGRWQRLCRVNVLKDRWAWT